MVKHSVSTGKLRTTGHFDEETRIPLLLVNPKVFRIGIRTDLLARQIDIGPTLLAFLGFSEPSAWQGASLFSAKGVERAYLFSRYGDFVFGLVEGPFKYIYDFNRRDAELYNLATDPHESDDLSRNQKYSAMMKRDHLRLEAWSLFQNSYLRKFQPAYKPLARQNLPSGMAGVLPTTSSASSPGLPPRLRGSGLPVSPDAYVRSQ